MIDLGIVKPGSTIYIPWGSYASSTGAPSAMTNLAVGDIKIYKDGGTTERASTTGFTLLDTDGQDFDALTGINGISIDLSSDATAGFYAAGSRYFVVIGDVTIDGQTVRFVAATFMIGLPGAVLNTTIATLSSQTSFTLTSGPAEDDALNGCCLYIHDVASAVQGGFAFVSDYTGSTKTVTLLAGTTFTAAASDNVMVMPPNNVAAWNATRVPAENTAGYPIVTVKDGTGTGEIDTASGRVAITEAQIDQIVDEVLDEDMTAHQTQGTLGQAIGDPVADTNSIFKAVVTDANAATVGLDTDNIRSRLPTSLVSGRIDASVGAMANDTVTAAAIAADAVREIRAVVSGTADSGTTTTMVDAARTEGDNDYWRGMVLLFTSGSLAGQARMILYFDTGSKTFTFTPATTQAVDTHTYEILPAVNVWDDSRDDHDIAGTTGKSLADTDSNAATTLTRLGTPTNLGSGATVGANLVDIEAQTDDIGAAGAGLTAITGKLPTALVGGRMDASVGAVNNVATAASRLAESAQAIVMGTADTGASTTSIPCKTLDPGASATDQFKGRAIIFSQATSQAALRGQAREITASSTTGGTASCTLTVAALTTAPNEDAIFTIV